MANPTDPSGAVDNLPIAPTDTNINPEFLLSHKTMSAAMLRNAIANEAIAKIGVGGKEARFTDILNACIIGRVATTVEGFLTFARELCDGIDREFPPAAGG